MVSPRSHPPRRGWQFGSTALLVGYLLLFPAAGTNADVIAATPPPTPVITLQGTLEKVNVSVGCFRLKTTNGESYQLIGRYPKRHGIRLEVSGRFADDVVGTCQIGRIFAVRSARTIGGGR
jgi:hypothetical protein